MTDIAASIGKVVFWQEAVALYGGIYKASAARKEGRIVKQEGGGFLVKS